ncbi:GtrA family protein [Parasphingorhabdus halotolerans]|uniref:GtrA family protein n=1 Tax=Parasphingorhabdus halotolerans TaxID=2725558 RepID=A0A6H2DJG6_9SPHN|nr:GtrA family protein [Parasphingorhabdus halotolerans]QJB68530.1 GtrA family protein [Parasphingorhabdus halotolerans]
MNLLSVLAEPRRYVSVGLICAIIHNVVVIGASHMGMHYMIALILSFAIVTPTGYALHTAYTFGKGYSWRQFARFTSGVAVGFPISFAIMVVLCSYLGFSTWVATPIATILLFLWNYASARWAILLGRSV